MYLQPSSDKSYFVCPAKPMANLNRTLLGDSILVKITDTSVILVFNKCEVRPSCKVYEKGKDAIDYENDKIVRLDITEKTDYEIYKRLFYRFLEKREIKDNPSEFFLWGKLQLVTGLGESVKLEKLTTPDRWEMVLESLEENLDGMGLPNDAHPIVEELKAVANQANGSSFTKSKTKQEVWVENFAVVKKELGLRDDMTFLEFVIEVDEQKYKATLIHLVKAMLTR